MRAGLVLAILIGTALPACAGEGFDIVIPGRPGVPIIINGVDASYSVVEGELGLGRGYQNQPVVYGGRVVEAEPNVGHWYPSLGHKPGYGRFEIRAAGKSHPAEAGRELSSVMVRGIRAAAESDSAATRRAVLSAAGDRRAAENGGRHAANRSRAAAGFGSHSRCHKKIKTHQRERVMRQTISGIVAAIAVVAAGTLPASACGVFESPAVMSSLLRFTPAATLAAAAGLEL